MYLESRTKIIIQRHHSQKYWLLKKYLLWLSCLRFLLMKCYDFYFSFTFFKRQHVCRTYSEDEICIPLPGQASSAPGGKVSRLCLRGKISALQQGPAVLRDSVWGKRRLGQVTKCSGRQAAWLWFQMQGRRLSLAPGLDPRQTVQSSRERRVPGALLLELSGV